MIGSIAIGTIDHRRAVDQFDIVAGERAAAGIAFHLFDLGITGQVDLHGDLLHDFGLLPAHGQVDQARAAGKEQHARAAKSEAQSSPSCAGPGQDVEPITLKYAITN